MNKLVTASELFKTRKSERLPSGVRMIVVSKLLKINLYMSTAGNHEEFMVSVGDKTKYGLNSKKAIEYIEKQLTKSRDDVDESLDLIRNKSGES